MVFGSAATSVTGSVTMLVVTVGSLRGTAVVVTTAAVEVTVVSVADVVVLGARVLSAVLVTAASAVLTGSGALTAVVSCIAAFFGCLAVYTAVEAEAVVVSAVYFALLVVAEVAVVPSVMVADTVSVYGELSLFSALTPQPERKRSDASTADIRFISIPPLCFYHHTTKIGGCL